MGYPTFDVSPNYILAENSTIFYHQVDIRDLVISHWDLI